MDFPTLASIQLVSGRNAKLIADVQLIKDKYLSIRLTRSWLDKETQTFVVPVFTNVLCLNDLLELQTNLTSLIKIVKKEQGKLGMSSVLITKLGLVFKFQLSKF